MSPQTRFWISERVVFCKTLFYVRRSNLELVEYCCSGEDVLRECVSSGEDVPVNTVIILRNFGAILADLRSKAMEEASIAPQF